MAETSNMDYPRGGAGFMLHTNERRCSFQRTTLILLVMKFILSTTYVSFNATGEAVVELSSPEVLCGFSCLQMQLLYVLSRDVLRISGLTVEQHQNLFIPHAIINTLYSSDINMQNATSS